MSKVTTNEVFGKPWSIDSIHASYDEANDRREGLLSDRSLQVKVRRYADGTFKVKARSLVTEGQKKRKQKADKAKRKKERRKRG